MELLAFDVDTHNKMILMIDLQRLVMMIGMKSSQKPFSSFFPFGELSGLNLHSQCFANTITTIIKNQQLSTAKKTYFYKCCTFAYSFALLGRLFESVLKLVDLF